ncbi:MAG: HDOD domain-containing protein [Spongiibacteraceae bacterium]|jgi:EAL and modified HD-GYP domain-containing signal transduction protein|nr:HDOD domain-containing protein [Spongiibacteraceae bacterium]
MSDQTVLFARQPIYDAQLNVVAYELLFRSENGPHAENLMRGDQATSQVIINVLSGPSLDILLDGKPAFVNFTGNLLKTPPPVSSEHLVVEVLEDIVVDGETVRALLALKRKGYSIALDDYRDLPTMRPFLRLADIVKLDILDLGLAETERVLQALKPYQVRIIAEKVETYAQFEACKAMGCDWFQGYFLARPQLIHGRRVSPGQQGVLRLLALMQNPDVKFDELESVIVSDPALSFKLLSLVNSALFNLANEVDSIQRAITMLGLERIRSWGSLLALTTLAEKPRALSACALLRARLCQRLGEQANSTTLAKQSLFTIGLLSTLDAYLDMPLTQIFETIAASPAVRDSVLERSGDAGLLLSIAQHMADGNIKDIDITALATLGIGAAQLEQLYIDSVEWTEQTLDQIFV